MNKLTRYAVALPLLGALLLPGVSSAQTVDALQAELNSLLAQLQVLQQESAAQSATAQSPSTAPASSASWCYTFSANLGTGATGAGVTALQTALQENGEPISITGTFDEQTEDAVTMFQEKYASEVLTPSGLTTGTGYVGSATRGELNALYGCGTGTMVGTVQTTGTPVSEPSTAPTPAVTTMPIPTVTPVTSSNPSTSASIPTPVLAPTPVTLLQVSPPNLGFMADLDVADDKVPASQTFTVTPSSAGAAWQAHVISTGIPGLSLSYGGVSGVSVSGTGTATITASVAQPAQPGSYNGIILVTSEGQAQTITVQLIVGS